MVCPADPHSCCLTQRTGCLQCNPLGFRTAASDAPVGVLLRVVRPVEVLAAEAGLAARHVAADNEVRRAVVAPHNHVLQALGRQPSATKR
jgi:hypothetical protein